MKHATRGAFVIGIASLIVATLTPAAAHADPTTVTISGTVLSAGVPVADVPVALVDSTEGAGSGRSDADGRFSFLAVLDPADRYWVTAGDARNRFRAAPREHVLSYTGASGTTALFPDLVAPIDGADLLQGRSGIQLEAIKPGSIDGTYSDRSGKSAVGVLNLGGDELLSRSIGKNGRFSIRDLTPGRYLLSFGTRSERLNTASTDLQRPVTVRSGQSTPVSVRRARGGRIDGLVTVGGRIPRQPIRMVFYNAENENFQSKETDARGRFSLGDLAKGRYTVAVGTDDSSKRTMHFTPKEVTAEITSDHDVKSVRVDLSEGTLLLGSVVRRDRHQTRAVIVVERPDRTVLRAETVTLTGRETPFRIENLPLGKIDVVAGTSDEDFEGYRFYGRKAAVLRTHTSNRVGTIAATRHALTLRAPVGRVDADDGFSADVATSTHATLQLDRFAVSNKAGTFIVRGLLPARYTVWTTADEGDRTPITTTVDLRADTTRPLLIGERTGTVVFDLSFPHDLAVQDLCLSSYAMLETASGRQAHDFSEAGGSFRLTYVPPGHYDWSALRLCTKEPVWLRPDGGFTVTAGAQTALGTPVLVRHHP